jgi:hypothetical protein
LVYLTEQTFAVVTGMDAATLTALKARLEQSRRYLAMTPPAARSSVENQLLDLSEAVRLLAERQPF